MHELLEVDEIIFKMLGENNFRENLLVFISSSDKISIE